MDQNRSRKQKVPASSTKPQNDQSKSIGFIPAKSKIQYKNPTFADIRDNKGIERLDGLEKYFIAATTHTPIWQQ
jgi:hypothetical protein